jgi:hypothetical protein
MPAASVPVERAASVPVERAASAQPSNPAGVLVWTMSEPTPGERVISTYWLSSEGSQVLGHVNGVLIAVGTDIWRWETKEFVSKIDCPDMQDRFDKTSTFVGAALQRVGSDERLWVVSGSEEPTKCMATMDSRVDLLGSVGSYVFVDSYYYDYGGGAHGVNIPQFTIWDIASRKQWFGWENEIVSSQVDLKRIEKAMGHDDRSRQTNDNRPPWVKLRPHSAKPTFGTDGKFSFESCFEADTNISDYNMAMSHGPIGAAECALGRVPERFASFEQIPVAVVEFAREHAKEVIRGWSILAGPMPNAAMRLLTNKQQRLFTERASSVKTVRTKRCHA